MSGNSLMAGGKVSETIPEDPKQACSSRTMRLMSMNSSLSVMKPPQGPSEVIPTGKMITRRYWMGILGLIDINVVRSASSEAILLGQFVVVYSVIRAEEFALY